ncbi:MAG: sigma-54 dependent transcriptional regulator [Proteobacteria bacterium]|nr:sigma-54 dependent transcriptional regulator [Pseudomonadota bacterium]MBU1714818.1 sigma-54 dependent transcriptional regulator [Pseudomonadota bacterium]
MKMIRVAIIDDEETAGSMIKRILDKEGFEVETFLAGQPFLNRMRQNPFQLAFIDLNLPDIDGMEILRLLKQTDEETEAIIITGHASIESAIEATRQGAFHYLTKPSRRHDILLLANRAREKIALREENKKLKLAMGKDNLVAGFVGSSPAMQEVFAMVKKVAMVNCNVLLQAETGTGKQLVARAIHALSPRKDQPFVYFNCGGFTEELICSELFGHEKGSFTGASSTKIGLFESAAGGTVLLDEIGEMPLSMQIKLLHVLQEREVLRVGGTKPIELDIRIIAATNKDLKQAILKGSFRDDLFYRLNVVGLHLPRLTERRDDIPLLISHFIEKFNLAFNKEIKRISPHAMELLMSYNFPGNVRELENIIQRGVALAENDELKVVDLPASLRELAMRGFNGEGMPTLAEMEKHHITKVLKLTGYNKPQAAAILDIPRTTLWRRMRTYNLTDES